MREASREDDLSEYPRRPFSDYMAELSMSPYDWLTYTHRSFFSPYIGDWTETNDSIRLTHADWGWVRLRYDYNRAIDEYTRQNRNQIRQYRLTTRLTFLKPWIIGGEYRIDQTDGQVLERLIQLAYQHQCWTVQLVMKSTDDEERFEARVVLMGLSF